MKQSSEGAKLSAELQALDFAAGCFDLGEKQHGLSREKRKRAKENREISQKQRIEVWSQLERHIRATLFQPPVSRLSFMAHELVAQLTQLCGRIVPLLKANNRNSSKTVWIVAEHVLIPTAFLLLLKHKGWSLGTELRPKSCWFLVHQGEEGTIDQPLQRVLDYWLRTAGFRTADGVSRDMPDYYKRKVNRWREGKRPRALAEVHEMVDRFKQEVEWLDDAGSWKTRFTFAWACQKAWDKADAEMRGECANPALHLSDTFKSQAAMRLLHDDEDLLIQPITFFAVRLLQQRSAAIKNVMKKVPMERKKLWKWDTTAEEERNWRAETNRIMNHGNWVADHLKLLASDQREQPGKSASVDATTLTEFIFLLGVNELNGLLSEQE